MHIPDTRHTHILLYHAAFAQVPPELSEGLHNVAPDVIEEQVRFMLRHFDCVALDDLLGPKAGEKGRGKFAITFDDAYQCVMGQAADRLLAMEVPFTVFVNTVTLQGKPFWRDKVRLLMAQGLVGDFLDWLPRDHVLKKIPADAFYRASKSKGVNSRNVDASMDAFFKHKGIPLPKAAHCVVQAENLRRHPLVSYGNHSHSHYVLASLSPEQQRQDIDRARQHLEDIGLHHSRIFSVPFGEENDFTPETVNLLGELGYRGFVYSRNRLNTGCGPALKHGLAALERYKAPDSLDGLGKHIKRLERRIRPSE